MSDIFVTHDGAIAVSHTGDCVIVALGSRDWDDRAWHEFMEHLVKIRVEFGLTIALAFASVRSPSAGQRRTLVEYGARGQIFGGKRCALFTGSAIARAGLSGIGWYLKTRKNFDMRAFKPTDHVTAMSWLNQENTIDSAEALRLLGESMVACGLRADFVAQCFSAAPLAAGP